MFRTLLEKLATLLGTSVSRILVGGGFALITGAVVYAATQAAMDASVGYMSGIPQDAMAIIKLSGLGSALSLIGSAVLTRLSWDTGRNFITVQP